MALPDFKMLTGRTDSHLIKININNYLIQIHPAIEHDLLQWQSKANNKGLDFAVASAFRSFDRQLTIWNEKVIGKRPLKDTNNQIVDITKLSEKDLVDTILLWSHIPGASRHHWGTDLDVFDATWFKKNNQLLDLNNELYLNQGPCAAFHQLNELLFKDKVPFYRPYISNNDNNIERVGFMSELWHYSHVKQSKVFEKYYTLDIFIQNLEEAPDLKLKSVLLDDPENYFRKFVTLS